MHGALEDASSWLRHTRVEDYAEEHQIAVVMPGGQNSFYVNAYCGLPYYDFITRELPRFAQYAFPVSADPDDRLIAGPSMGGYGAARCALGQPDAYAAFGVFSGAVDPFELEPMMLGMGFDIFRYDLLFGGTDKLRGSDNDLFALVQGLKKAAKHPKGFIYCGLEDTNNYAMNLRFHQTLAENGFDTRFYDGHGLHDWAYWDMCIRDFLDVSLGVK